MWTPYKQLFVTTLQILHQLVSHISIPAMILPPGSHSPASLSTIHNPSVEHYRQHNTQHLILPSNLTLNSSHLIQYTYNLPTGHHYHPSSFATHPPFHHLSQTHACVHKRARLSDPENDTNLILWNIRTKQQMTVSHPTSASTTT